MCVYYIYIYMQERERKREHVFHVKYLKFSQFHIFLDDSNRVELHGVGEGYINASHIRIPVAGTLHHYIACQGPLPQTTGDFWRMVWQQKADVIAMLTMVSEGGKVKCHCYWPDTTQTSFTVQNRSVMGEHCSFV